MILCLSNVTDTRLDIIGDTIGSYNMSSEYQLSPTDVSENSQRQTVQTPYGNIYIGSANQKKQSVKLRISKHDIKSSSDFIIRHIKLIRNQNNLQISLYKKATNLIEILFKFHNHVEKQRRKETHLKSTS